MPENEPAAVRRPTVVGVGASAGGLAALKTLFRHTPPDAGLAYVVVVHLSPEHKSHLAELLQPHVDMPVQQVTETVPLEPNRVYVIPPNANLEAVDTHLRLARLPQRRAERAPIDHFLRTLAATHDGNSIGVILTGTGGDGTLGLREIRSKGGLTVVQDPSEAEFDGMPRSAVMAGVADRVLPLSEIPRAIDRFARVAPRMPALEEGKELDKDARQELQTVLALVRARTGRDFTRYKHNTILRRIGRRMHLNHVETMAGYIDVLRSQPEEVTALADDFLITVTSFFRDPDFYRELETNVVPRLVQSKNGDDLRVWSVGCSTGEEAYSIAMILHEAVSASGPTPPFQVFATDLHEASVERARAGFYPIDIEGDVSAERLERFFTRESDGYRIRKSVREGVLFAPHNLLSDPPFSHIDLILCRNLLIYLQRDVQEDVAELFHYALEPDGMLALGAAERIEMGDLFRAEKRKEGLYRKRSAPRNELRLPVFPMIQHAAAGRGRRREPQRSPYGSLHKEMAERYALPSILLSPEDNVVFLSAAATRYLDVRAGALTQNVHRLIRDELQMELRQAVHQARRQGTSQRADAVRIPFETGTERVSMKVTPSDEAEEDGYLFVTFDARPVSVREPSHGGTEEASEDQILDGVTAERDEARDRIRALIEEYETRREEMRASNEELQSVNEELRSAMEELETSKEELQSLNEELQTVNEENRRKVEELAQLSSDLQNLLSATGIATIFLDRQLRILRFTPKVGELFNVRPTDRGRPLSDLTHHFGEVAVVESAREVLRTLVPVELELRDENGCWYLTRVLPYRSEEDRIEGVVITLVEITSRKRVEEDLRAAQAELAHELLTSRRLYDMTARALTATGTEEMLQEVLHAAIDLLGADFGTMQLLHGGRLEIVAQSGLPQSFLDAFESVTAEEASICARALDTGRRVAVQDVTADADSESLREVFASADVRGVQSTPLVSRRGEVLGMLSTHFRQPYELSERQARLADIVAQQAADVVERIRGEEELQRLNETLEERVAERTREVRELASALAMAEQEERRRISQLLHEDLQQLLYGIQMTLASARKKGEAGNTAALLEQTSRSLDLLGKAVGRTRQLSVDLSPPVLEGDGLVEALEWLRPQMRDLHGLEVEVRAPREIEEPTREVMILAFTTVRELLFNVAKHAGVAAALVEVEERDGCLEVSVVDAGQGFDASAPADPRAGANGLGLAGARQRLRFHGGELRVTSKPGRGTRVTLEIPLPG